MNTTIRRAASLGLLSALVGCSVQSSPTSDGPQEEAVGKQQAHLFGAAEINDCSSARKAFIQKSINIGKFFALTDEYKSCVKANYISCDDDDNTSVTALVSATHSVNPVKIGCDDLGFTLNAGGGGSGVMGSTGYWSQHGYDYDGQETFDIDNTYAQMELDSTASGSFFGFFSVAGTIWHEAMHTHGYEHGNSGADTASQQAIDNADSCGRSSATWNWRKNSAPYDVGFCMVGAYTQQGAIGVDNGDPGAAARKSIVDLYYNQAHKFLSASKRTDTFNRIGAGTLTSPAALKLEAAGNSLYTQPSSLTFNGGAASDKLFDSQDQEYWQVTLPSDDRLRVDVTYSAGSPKPTLSIHRLSYGYLYTVGSPAGVASSTTYSSSLDQDLKAGTYLIKVKAGAGTSLQNINISASTAAAPKTPTSCSGFINCLGHVHVTCANEAEDLVLQRSTGYLWSNITEDKDRNRSSVDLVDPGPFGRYSTVNYRVCAKSYGKTSCGASFSVNVLHQQCYTMHDCDNQMIFACFIEPGDEKFCCHEQPVIDTTIPTVQIPGPIPEYDGLALTTSP
jgi:hypothetical protein